MEEQRLNMVSQLQSRKILESKMIIEAMKKVPRHLFVPLNMKNRAYEDNPLQIDCGQTISAPHMNAMMCEYLQIEKGQKILEIGTGSGYHCALLAEIVGNKGKIYSIERVPRLAKKASKVLRVLNYDNIEIITGDGSCGHQIEAPYDRILVTAASPQIPEILIQQLSENGGIMCIPTGKQRWIQDLLVIKRHEHSIEKKCVSKVIFVPLIGKFGFKE
ncbi:Protein-L-isoaspartate O-methyltransferase [Candidatus Lokiarchaeum ossiferum]|uniref:Protein-L-isoaspartate O-methyltransferase n=1 Tax=Candidatus Lokiarchaeum ossiferum TaxID=2951803 RepID=A0ABY6HS82_9ARCH|nr:Protein-L-isoaspartate O-methyltransferase [Candidatus Lokiarchaeum sp. B-35]